MNIEPDAIISLISGGGLGAFVTWRNARRREPIERKTAEAAASGATIEYMLSTLERQDKDQEKMLARIHDLEREREQDREFMNLLQEQGDEDRKMIKQLEADYQEALNRIGVLEDSLRKVRDRWIEELPGKPFPVDVRL